MSNSIKARIEQLNKILDMGIEEQSYYGWFQKLSNDKQKGYMRIHLSDYLVTEYQIEDRYKISVGTVIMLIANMDILNCPQVSNKRVLKTLELFIDDGVIDEEFYNQTRLKYLTKGR